MIDIGALTTDFVSVLTGHSLLIGDGLAPNEGGWATGMMNTGQFTAYSVVGFDGASPDMPSLALEPDWSTQWSLRHYGASRKQVDYQAAAARAAVYSMLDRRPGGGHKVIGVVWSRLGPVVRNDQVDPPVWSTVDSVKLLCSA